MYRKQPPRRFSYGASKLYRYGGPAPAEKLRMNLGRGAPISRVVMRRLLLLLVLGCLAGTCSVDGLVVSGYLLHRPPPRPITVVACDVEPSLRELVQRDRLIRRSGIGAGAVLVATTASIGSSAGVVDAGALLPLVLAGGVLAGSATYARFLSNEESQQACPDDFFTVAESPGKGKGLFATCAIEQGTFLFDCNGGLAGTQQFATLAE